MAGLNSCLGVKGYLSNASNSNFQPVVYRSDPNYILYKPTQ
jgi:hypothetical protein